MSAPFAVGGIIEGFYGVPWTHAQRLDMIEFIGDLGMNTFVYGPKDDAYLRRDWRVEFGDDELSRLGELVDACRRSGVTFSFALSPGLSMRYSDPVRLRVARRQVRPSRWPRSGAFRPVA